MTRLAVALILFAALLLRLPGLDAPFFFPHEEDNALYSQAARNLLRHGVAATRAHVSLAVAGERPSPATFYLNHPPTLAWLIAFSHALFGPRDWATRLVPLLFSLAGLHVLYRVTARRFNQRTALFALAIAAFLPLSAYYGRVVKFETVILPLGILAIDHGLARTPRPLMVAVFLGLACLVDYGAYLLIPGLILLSENRRKLVLPLAVAGGVLALHFLMVVIAGGPERLTDLFFQGARRGGLAGELSPLSFLRRQVLDYFLWNGFTPVGGLLALLGGIAFLDRMRRGDHAGGEAARFLGALLLWGGLYVLVFPQAAMHHDYWQSFLIPGVAILMAFFLDRRRPLIALILLLLFLDQSTRILYRRYYADPGWYAHEFRAVSFAHLHAGEKGVILVREPIHSSHPLWYADRRFIHSPTISQSFALHSETQPAK